jgi:hypothetical protein
MSGWRLLKILSRRGRNAVACLPWWTIAAVLVAELFVVAVARLWYPVLREMLEDAAGMQSVFLRNHRRGGAQCE